MAENTEIDAINHLLEVEKNASALINDAAQEADRRLSEARSKYNAEYKTRYSRKGWEDERRIDRLAESELLKKAARRAGEGAPED